MSVKPLRLSLTLSGGASLGAFEAGAAAALITAWRRMNVEEEVDASIDAIGGASAGAIVGMFSAHCVLSGADPVELLRKAWVEKVTLSLLRGRTADAPLSFEELREDLPEIFDDFPPQPGQAQDRPLALQISLTGLRGLAYPIQGRTRSEPIRGVTYADWGRFELQPGGDTDQLLKPEGASPLDFVLASASSPGGFAPTLVDRSDDSDAYADRGIEDFPDHGRLWYTDGGLVASQPIGRTFAAGRLLHGQETEAQHLNLLIDPRSEVSAGDEPWSDPESKLSWQTGISRALAILSQQDLFEDLRRIEKDNSRLGWIEDLIAELSPQLKQGSDAKLRKFVETVRSDLAEVRSDEPELGKEDAKLENMSTENLLRLALLETSGLRGKQALSLDVISPLILADDDDPKSLLAGEFMGDFGGFLSESSELRTSRSATRQRRSGSKAAYPNVTCRTAPSRQRLARYGTQSLRARPATREKPRQATSRYATERRSSDSPHIRRGWQAPAGSTCAHASPTRSGSSYNAAAIERQPPGGEG